MFALDFLDLEITAKKKLFLTTVWPLTQKMTRLYIVVPFDMLRIEWDHVVHLQKERLLSRLFNNKFSRRNVKFYSNSMAELS